ncbi:MAG: hypothetical protein HY645_09110 [Acidobacteria bacterium]|nr:hypothetical protein [Acidobacteriota bacterium]
MKLNQSFAGYLKEISWGILLLALIAVIRFLMKPVFEIPYERGTNWASLNILLFVLITVYAFRAARRGDGLADLAIMSVMLAFTSALLTIAGIAVDEFAGVDTYFTDPAHGGGMQALAHMGGHLVAGIIVSVALWVLGTLVFFASHVLFFRKQKRMAS